MFSGVVPTSFQGARSSNSFAETQDKYAAVAWERATVLGSSFAHGELGRYYAMTNTKSLFVDPCAHGLREGGYAFMTNRLAVAMLGYGHDLQQRSHKRKQRVERESRSC
jgi:hypothetical protein